MAGKPIDFLLNAVEWTETDHAEHEHGDGLYATHEGVLWMGDVSLRCYTLNNGARVFDADDVDRFFAGNVTGRRDPAARSDD